VGWYRSPGFRGLAVAASDGIIGTAGVLQGFAGAGASSTTLLIASMSALVAGSAAEFGSKYAELAADRDAERALIAEEERDLREDASDELADLTAHFEERGVERELARRTAEQMFAHDPLAAQLEVEHGITGRTSAVQLYVGAFGTALAFAVGSTLPLAILLAYPAAWETWAVFIAVLLSLAVTSVLISISAGTSVPRALARTLTIGAVTMALSFAAGVIVF
jgi:VIT1/CCC1 family predicted Fe2+/Mn2+ transporter